MRLYRTKGLNADEGIIYLWDGTQADAAARRKRLKADGVTGVETKEVDVPTSKAELLTWLNENCGQPGE